VPNSSIEPVGPGRATVSVVMPCLNEERNLPYVFERMPDDVDEVIVVDGGSVDRTVDCALALRTSVKVVQQSRRGKGNALVCGLDACTGDIIVMIDGDGSTDPAEIPRFVETLRAGADFAKGSRFLPGGGSQDITRTRRLGNSALSSTVNALFGTGYSDLCYGYNAFWRWVVPYLDLPEAGAAARAPGGMLWGDGFEIETLINVRAAALGLRVREVPSVEAARLHGVSNLSAFRDGRHVLRTIMREHGRIRRAARSGQGVAMVRPADRSPYHPNHQSLGAWAADELPDPAYGES
jgi:glycosyltransferase involved in cell wall biosynthesis